MAENNDEIHGFFMIGAWFAAVHLGLWSLYLKHTKYGTLLHGILMTLLVIFMSIGATIQIAHGGL